jgi:hypothetical protein
MNTNYCLTVLSLLFLVTLPAHAAEKEQKDTPLTVLEKANAEMVKGLDENQLKQFALIDNSYLIIRTIEDVQQSITRAVTSCSVANPEIKESLSGRFEVWKDNIRPVLKKARAKLDSMIAQQSFTQPSAVRTFLKKVDAAAIYRNQKIRPTPIEKLEDCQRLQTNMDSTQTNLIALITENLALNSELKVKE